MSIEPRAARDLGAHRHLVVSERLRERRRDLGLTQKEVVSRLRRIGVDTTNKALSSLEHGAGLDVAKLPELAAALDCTLTYLLGLTDDPGNWQPDPGHWPRPAVASGQASGRSAGARGAPDSGPSRGAAAAHPRPGQPGLAGVRDLITCLRISR